MDVSEAYANELDQQDPLKEYRQCFYLPADSIYFLGNSLGLMSKEAEQSVLSVVRDWQELGIGGWLHGKNPWFYFSEKMGERISPLLGAKPEEIVATGTTTVNIHALVSSLFLPAGKKQKILADSLNFPSDIYALCGQLKQKGLNPNTHLVLIPAPASGIFDEDLICSYFTDDIALALLPSVFFQSGQLLDMKYLTQKAHQKNIVIGFDCSHSAGAIPHCFSDWEVDFAVFCSYKYLNAGPGSSAFLYINQNHFSKEPLMAGWFGFQKDKQFDFSLKFNHQQSAGGWQISSPSILGSAALAGSLKIFQQAGIHAIREKSLNMTGYFIDLLEYHLESISIPYRLLTPKAANRRGGHIALEFPNTAWRLSQALKANHIMVDFRSPHTLRMAPAALYNTYGEIRETVITLKKIIDLREYEAFPEKISPIT
jgi:kynureninase